MNTSALSHFWSWPQASPLSRQVVSAGELEARRSLCRSAADDKSGAFGVVLLQKRQRQTLVPPAEEAIQLRRQSRFILGNHRGAIGRLLLFSLLASFVAGCSGQSDDDRRSVARSKSKQHTNIVGEQTYVCDNGSVWDVDFLGNGLQINLRRVPKGEVERLTAPAQGLRFVGDRVAATVSGRGLVIEYTGRRATSCQRS